MVDTTDEMTQVSSPHIPRRALAPAILRVRTAAYLTLAGFVMATWIIGRNVGVLAVVVLLVAAGVPFLDRGARRWHRVELAIVIDVVVSALAWWRLPNDPVLPLVITLWAVAIGAFFCSEEVERFLIGAILATEVAKLPLSLTVFADRFGPSSAFREIFDSEVLVQAGLTIGRIGILAATYLLFRTVSQIYRRSQVDIEESEQRFRTLVESSPNAILVVRTGEIVFANSAAPALFGIEPGRLTGRRISDFVPREDHVAAALFEETELGHVVHRFDNVTMHRADGSICRIDLTLAPTRYEGAPAIQIVAVDVTERFEAAETIRRSEERYREFFEQLPVALYRTSPDGRILDANAETVRLLGVADESELVDRMASTFYVDSDDRSEFGEAIIRHGWVMGQEVLMRRATGETMWVSDSARIVSTPDGEIYEGALIDITDRKRAQDEAHTRAVQQETVARIGHLALSGASLDEVFAASADAMARELGADITGVLSELPEGSIVLRAGHGWPIDGPGPLSAPPEARSLHRLVLDSPTPVLIPDLTTEARFVTSTSLLALGARAGTSVKIPGTDRPVGMLAAFRKSPRHFSADDVQFLETLASIIGAAIERHEAAARLEELVRSKDQFVATVSHEVRTPLTVVSGIAHELLERWDEFDPGEVKELIGLLVDQSREMSDLVEDLLVSARADIGKVEIRPEPTQLQDQLRAVLEPLHTDEIRRITLGGDPATANADPVRLRQILRNLVTNALRYGGPDIRVVTGNGGPISFIEVRDNGEEIAVDQQETIFEPYHQAHESRGRTSSVGLGLAVSRTLAELMDGTLTYSHDGESVFRLTLPAA